MKLAYQIATEDVMISPSVTAFQGDVEHSFRRLSEVGYDGAELMVCDPRKIDVSRIQMLMKKYSLEVPMVCTGEVFGQGRVFFTSTNDEIRGEAIARARSAIDVAHALNSQINLGRIRGPLVEGVPFMESYNRAMDAFKELAEYGERKNVTVALEPVNTLAINFINSSFDGLKIVREVNHKNFTMMLDTGHMHIDDKDELFEIERCNGNFTYVHLVDSNRKFLGNCKFDFKAFIHGLKQVGYNGYLSVEVFQIPDQETALVNSFNHIKPLI